jgi:hypothetical protein
VRICNSVVRMIIANERRASPKQQASNNITSRSCAHCRARHRHKLELHKHVGEPPGCLSDNNNNQSSPSSSKCNKIIGPIRAKPDFSLARIVCATLAIVLSVSWLATVADSRSGSYSSSVGGYAASRPTASVSSAAGFGHWSLRSSTDGEGSRRSALSFRAGTKAPAKTKWNKQTAAKNVAPAQWVPSDYQDEPTDVLLAPTTQPDNYQEPIGNDRTGLPIERPRSSPLGSARLTRQTDSSQKCALILQRTYVRRLSNDIDNTNSAGTGELEPTGRAERVCITYEHVNEAIEEAKRRRNFKLDPELMLAIQSIEPLPPFISKLGELNLETVKVLKEQFDLSPDEISEGLPLIDMSRTNFWPICPLLVKPIRCDPTGRFRSFTGHCNNLDNPTWGASQTPYVRYLPAKHPDGIEEFRRSVVENAPLPPARLVSSTIHRDVDQPSGDLSLFIMIFGQLVDHELTQAAPPRGE